jgi:hypothetical protein
MEPEGLMEQEESYIKALSSAVTYRLVTKNRLEIEDVTSEVILVFTRGGK